MGQGWGEWGRASFQGPLSAPSRFTAGPPLFALSSLYYFLPWFSQIRKPSLALLAQDVPPSSPDILKATGEYFSEETFAENPLFSPCRVLGLFFPSSIQ